VEANNFETAQHIDKQITVVSSTINVLKDGTKVTLTHRVLMQNWWKFDDAKYVQTHE